MRFFFLLSLTGLWLLPVFGFGQQYPFVPVPNSPHGIFRMMQDSHSRLWLGTIDDAVCFDGVNFYSLRQYGFPKETPDSFAEDSEGGIWIATQGPDGPAAPKGNLFHYKNGHVEKIISGDGMSVASVAPGVVLASMGREVSNRPSYSDLYRIQNNKGHWTPQLLLPKTAGTMTVDHAGNVLFPCPGGWCEFSRESMLNWRGGDARKAMQQHPGDPAAERILRDRYGCIWQRAEQHASYQCPGEAQPTRLPYEISQYDSAAHLSEGQDGSIFMMVPLLLGRPGAYKALGSEGLPSDLDSGLLASDGTIWLGTDNGLVRFPYPFHIEQWTKTEGLRVGQTFFKRIGDRIYTTSMNLAYLSPDRRNWVLLPNTDLFGQIGDILPLPGNRILVTAVKGIAVYQADTGKLLASLLTPEWQASILAQSRDGQIFVGDHGVSRIQIDGSKISLHPELVPQNAVPELRYDKANDIVWACDGKELIYRKDGRWQSLSTKDGLLDANCALITPEASGNLWIGYANAAYAYIANPTSEHRSIHNFTEHLNDLVANNAVNMIAVDSRDEAHENVWLRNEVLNLGSSQAAHKGDWLRLNETDGLGTVGAPTRQAGFVDNDGSLWIGNNLGVLRLAMPAGFTTSFPAPALSVAGFAVGGAAPQLADALSTLPRNQDITAELAITQFDRRNALHFRYRLLPQQSSWTSTSSTALPLGQLSWGSHTLQVQAQLSTGPWSTISEQTFIVARPLWLTWPVLAGFAIFAAASTAIGWQWRKKRRIRSAKAFPELGEWRLTALSPELQQLNGTMIAGRFEVGRILARGGFATVAEGRDTHHNDRPCAIKIFRQEFVDKNWMARRFQQEVLALSKIAHPNVVRIYASGTLPEGTFYLVMEFIDGVTLRDLLEIGKLPPQRVASYLRQAGSALDQIHAQGICHRDLKPENLMIRNEIALEESLVLIDFSIAIVKDPDETLHGLSRAAGTIYYMAPEQAIGYADTSTDIYSLAKIVIEMLTGERLSILLPDASMDLPDRVRELLSNLPLRLGSSSIELLSSALEFDPARRPKHAAGFAHTIASDLEAELHVTV